MTTKRLSRRKTEPQKINGKIYYPERTTKIERQRRESLRVPEKQSKKKK